MENIEEVREEVEQLKNRVERLEHALQRGQTTRSQSSLRTLLQNYDPSSHTERALVIGYYLEKFEGRDGFTTGDLRDGYIESKTPLPANLSDVIAKTGEKGWAMPIGEEDQRQVWQITGEGERLIEQGTQDTE